LNILVVAACSYSAEVKPCGGGWVSFAPELIAGPAPRRSCSLTTVGCTR